VPRNYFSAISRKLSFPITQSWIVGSKERFNVHQIGGSLKLSTKLSGRNMNVSHRRSQFPMPKYPGNIVDGMAQFDQDGGCRVSHQVGVDPPDTRFVTDLVEYSGQFFPGHFSGSTYEKRPPRVMNTFQVRHITLQSSFES